MSSKKQRKATDDNREGSNVVGVRFSPELLSLLDREVKRQQEAAPWLELSRADVIRKAVYQLVRPSSLGELLTTRPAPKEQPASPTSQPSTTRQRLKSCAVCGGPLPPRHTTLCKDPDCKREMNARRMREAAQREREAKEAAEEKT